MPYTRIIVPLAGGTAFAALLHSKGSKPCNVFNTDTANNNVYLSGDQSTDIRGSNYTILRPLGSYVLTGEENTYALGTIANQVVEVSPATQVTPAPSDLVAQIESLGLATLNEQISQNTAIPSNIFTTGVPLYTSSNSLQSDTARVLAASASFTEPAVGVSQIGYEVWISVTATLNTVSLGGVEFTFTWTDVISGQITDVQNWGLPGGNGTAQTYKITGPTSGNVLTITAKNRDSTNSITFSYVILQNSRVYNFHDGQQLSTNTIPNETNGNYDTALGLLLSYQIAFAANAVIGRVGVLSPGQSGIVVSAPAGPVSSVVIQPVVSSVGAIPNYLYSAAITAAGGGNINDVFNNLRSPFVVAVTNGANAQTINLAVTRGEYKP
jgi:hypothetical protein